MALDSLELIGEFEAETTDRTVWFQSNRLFGSLVEEQTGQFEARRERALGIIGIYSPASQLVRMRSTNPETDYVDLTQQPAKEYHRTDALIAMDPNLILWANSADCGEVAMEGFSPRFESDVIALIHANRESVERGSHNRTLEYMVDHYELTPEEIFVRMSPSAREGYRKKISEKQQKDSGWDGFLTELHDGTWHVDFHGRTVSDLRALDIPEDNIVISNVDTSTNPYYFSYMQQAQGNQPKGHFNATMFALR